MKGNEAFGYEIIRKLQEMHPTWKMNVKFDNDRQKMQRNQKQFGGNMPFPQQNNMSYPPYPPQMQRPPYPNYMHPNHMPLPVPQHNMPSLSEKIIGVKPCRIFVRELWLGGIPENYDKAQMAHIMSYYGIIEEIEIFPKFAFIKYKQAAEATTAFERAEEIFNRLGNPQGFRIFFSDPARRAYIVSNNY